MRNVQLGQRETVLHNRTIWLCASCETCTTRCPQGVDLAGDGCPPLLAREPALPPAGWPPSTRASLNTRPGRVHESLLAVLLARRRATVPRRGEGRRCCTKGRCRCATHRATATGCAALQQMEPGVRAVTPTSRCCRRRHQFDRRPTPSATVWGLREVPDWVCGATPAHATSHLLSVAARHHPGEGVGKPRRRCPGRPVVAACAACVGCVPPTKAAPDPALRAGVGRHDRLPWAGGGAAPAGRFVQRPRGGRIRARVKRPLDGLKVACYYGCLLTPAQGGRL